MKWINVLIKDGNRTISWEHPVEESIGYVLDSHDLHPVKDSVLVNLQPCKNLYDSRLNSYEPVHYKGIERIVILLQSKSEKKKGKKK